MPLYILGFGRCLLALCLACIAPACFCSVSALLLLYLNYMVLLHLLSLYPAITFPLLSSCLPSSLLLSCPSPSSRPCPASCQSSVLILRLPYPVASFQSFVALSIRVCCRFHASESTQATCSCDMFCTAGFVHRVKNACHCLFFVLYHHPFYVQLCADQAGSCAWTLHNQQS